MRLFLCMLPLTNLNIIGIQFFQATGRPKHSIALNIIKNVFCLMPALFLLPRAMGLNGVWLAYPCCDLGASFFVGAVLWREMKRLRSNCL